MVTAAKRRLLLGRKTMTNLDSILKSRDTTLTTKVHLVKGMVSPVVWYLQTCGVNLSVSYLFSFSYSSWGSQGKNTEVVCHSLLQWRANSLEKTLMLGKIEGRRRMGQQRMRWLDSLTDSMR